MRALIERYGVGAVCDPASPRSVGRSDRPRRRAIHRCAGTHVPPHRTSRGTTSARSSSRSYEDWSADDADRPPRRDVPAVLRRLGQRVLLPGRGAGGARPRGRGVHRVLSGRAARSRRRRHAPLRRPAAARQRAVHPAARAASTGSTSSTCTSRSSSAPRPRWPRSLRTGTPLVSSYHNELQARGVKGLLFAGYDTDRHARGAAPVGRG